MDKLIRSLLFIIIYYAIIADYEIPSEHHHHFP